ncbi:MAG TPA: hypothetical protein VNN76_10095 [Bacteroidota bacterium]|nr:hypothetical protein [Bacteroidota bacterium]
MATKPPPAVAEFPQETPEKLAYSIVADIPTVEPNDRNRLGYHIWAWLRERKGTLEQAVKTSGSRTEIPLDEVYKKVKARLEEKGIRVE